MVKLAVFIIACALAAAAPFFINENRNPKLAINAKSPAFPTEFEGKLLEQLPLTAREEMFQADFPGKVARFSDGRREIIVRFVTEATRKLHPATDCFVATGYKTKPLPMKIDGDGKRWSCFAAVKNSDSNKDSLRVCERISTTDEAQSWTDVSAWYWSALFAENGEWWAITTAETFGQTDF